MKTTPPQKSAKPKVRTCRCCGCTEDNACYDFADGACHWVERDLCSACTEVTIRIVKTPKWIGGSGTDCCWVAEITTPTKRRGTSLGGASAAAKQCALNFFFGGATRRMVNGRANRLQVKKRGRNFVATYQPEAA